MSKEGFVPDGFVPLAEWDHRSRSGNDGHSAEYKALRAAADAGEIDAFQIGGSKRWYVSRSDAVRLLESQLSDSPKQSKAKPQATECLDCHASALALVRIDNRLGLMIDILERLATAVETLATQPKTPQHELLHTLNSNGFHS
jgi:hypothetical protein